MKGRLRTWVVASALFLLAGIFLGPAQTKAQAAVAEHVYYAYVPPSTDFIAQVDELIRGTMVNYTVPSGVAILDVVGVEDDTLIEIWDIYAEQKIDSAVIDRLEKKVFYIHVGTFFKIKASRRIAAMLTGGQSVIQGGSHGLGGTSMFYPAVDGGFRGREFIFAGGPGTHLTGYSNELIGYNFYLVALEETDWTLSDAVNVWSTSEHLAQRATRPVMLQSRVAHLSQHIGAGNDVVFHLTTSSDVEVLCSALGDFVSVPAFAGGYVGRMFYAPIAVTVEQAGRTAAFIVVPLEEGKVTIYDKDLNVIATHSFTASDVEDVNYWYHELGVGRFDLIAESTGDVAFMVGQTEGTAEIGYLGDDITFIGSRPGQEIRFYAPTMAVVFAPEALTVTIDGGTPIPMAKDGFRLLESGIHSVSADRHVIVEVLAAGPGWNNWGSYLIEPLDVDASFETPEGFLSRPVDYTIYVAVGAVAAIAVLAVFMVRRRRLSRS